MNAKPTNTESVISRLQQTALPSVEAVNVLRAPEGPLHVKDEFAAYGDEQVLRYKALASEEAADAERTAAGLLPSSAAQTDILERAKAVAKDTSELHQIGVKVLTPHATRTQGQTVFFRIRAACLLTGDALGAAGALLLLGEMPAVALVQAAGVGVAIVTVGLLGSEIKARRAAKKRAIPKEELTADQKRFEGIFSERDGGAKIAKSMLWFSGTVGISATAGIGMLRALLGEPLIGVVFSGFSLAIVVASFASSYIGTDVVDDLLRRLRRDVERADRRVAKLASSDVLRRFAEYIASAKSIRERFSLDGAAARKRVDAELSGVLRRNPSVAGHGWQLGRRQREEES